MVQLNRYDWRDYLANPNPIAAALMVRMAVAPADRWRVKAAALRLLAGLPLPLQRRRMLGQFIDLYTPLNRLEEVAVQEALADLPGPAQENLMEMITSWERKARAEGKAEGKVEGQREPTLRLLSRKVGVLPEAILAQVNALSPEHLLALSDALLEFASPADLADWLARHAHVGER